jgi:hypothetical protein
MPTATWNKVKTQRITIIRARYHGAEDLAFPRTRSGGQSQRWGGMEALMSRKVGDHVEMDQEEARAGETGHHVRYILAFGVLLVLFGFGAVAMGWFG